MSLYAQESFVNATDGYRCGDSDVYETFADTPGDLFRAMRREYGRCTGRVYIDTEDGVRSIGWVFVKREQYQDADESYLKETWVTVHDAPPTVTREHHYHELAA